MSLRRQMLLAIANNYKWLPYSFEYLYHSLIPATINNKQVKDKTRLFKIEGNSEVVNQLFDYRSVSTDTNNGITFTNNNDGSFTLSGQASALATFSLINKSTPIFPVGHTILVLGQTNNSNYYIQGYSSASGVAVFLDYNQSMFTMPDTNTSNNFVRFRVASGTDLSTPITITPRFIDLTQRYPFDTPTSLTDNRVQNIINRGSEDFNSGEIKNTSLGGFVSEGFNICDEIFEGGVLGNIGQTESGSNSFRTKNYQEVLPNQTLNLHASATMFGTLIVCEYDKDKNFVLRSFKYESDQALTTQQNTKYIKIAFYKSGSLWQANVPTPSEAQVCINVSSSLNGTYKPHLNRLPTEYQEVEYIESTGTQYIDSGVIGNLNTEAVLDIQLTDTSALTQAFIGARTSNDNSAFLCGVSSSGYFYPQFDSVARTTITTQYTDGLRHTLKLSKNGFYFDGTLSSSFSSPTSFTTPQNMLLFAMWENNVSFKSKIKFYSCKLYDNGTLIRHFIPCFRKSDNEIGLFDLVNQVFYTNQGTGTFLKGANVNSVSDLSFAYQGSGVGTSHDSVEKTATEWVFTKANVELNLGGATWEYTSVSSSTFGFYTTSFSSLIKASTQNFVLNTAKYHKGTIGDWNDQNNIWIGSSKAIGIADRDNGSSPSDFKTYLQTNNVKMLCELATPQAIRIPLKRLAVVDLGKITDWTTYGSYTNTTRYISNYLNTLAPNVAPCYCAKFITTSDNETPNSIYIGTGNGKLTIKTPKNKYANTNELIADLQGQYLFYETRDEVADIDLTMGSEAGGTLNSYDFKWIKNQLRKDDISYSGNLTITTNSNNNIVITGSTSLANTFAISLTDVNSDCAIKLNHKYLIAFKGKETRVKAYRIYVYSQSSYVANIGDIDSPIIVSGSQTYAGNYFRLAISPTADEVFNDELELMIIDLTKAQLDDATSINDPRIQRIIKLGYIPTDINGTLTYEETEVLPNVDVKEKAK